MAIDVARTSEQLHTLSMQLPAGFRAGVLSALAFREMPGEAAASYVTTEALLARSRLGDIEQISEKASVILPRALRLKLSPRQQETFTRHAQVLCNRTGLLPRTVVEHLLIELSLLDERGKPSAPISRPNRTSVLTNLRDRNLFQIQEMFEGILEAFNDEPSIARTAASLVMHHQAYANGAEAFEVYKRAKAECLAIFGAADSTKNIALTAAGLVFDGSYPDAATACAAYKKALADTSALCSADSETARLTGLIAHRVFCGKLKSPAEGVRIYKSLLQQSKDTFGDCEETSGVMRTAALLVFTSRYKDIQAAHRVYLHLLSKALRVFGADPQCATLVRTAANVVFAKEYRSVGEVLRETKKLQRTISSHIGGDPLLTPFARTVLTAVVCGKYSSVPEALRELRVTVKACESLFSVRADTKRLTGTAIAGVFLRQYKSAAHAFISLLDYQDDVASVFLADERLSPYARHATYLLFHRRFSNASQVAAAYLAAISEIKAPGSSQAITSAAAFRLVLHRVAPSALKAAKSQKSD
jgi:hypothetical protein